MSQVVVSTECPTCSGPLDLSEGANAIRCPSCGSNLLVTGRKQVLSYWVAPKVKAEVAGAVARTGRLEARVAGARLFFVPFYRLTGHDFQWQDVPAQARAGERSLPHRRREPGRRASPTGPRSRSPSARCWAGAPTCCSAARPATPCATCWASPRRPSVRSIRPC